METDKLVNDRVVSKFEFDVMNFNEKYKLPNLMDADRDRMVKQLKNFRKIMLDEIAEADLIIEAIEYKTMSRLEVLAGIADWLGDMQVYAASEMVKWRLPVQQTLDIIMASNASKLGADGLPITNPETGKIEKGPNYWKPEPFLKQAIERMYNKLMGAAAPQ